MQVVKADGTYLNLKPTSLQVGHDFWWVPESSQKSSAPVIGTAADSQKQKHPLTISRRAQAVATGVNGFVAAG